MLNKDEKKTPEERIEELEEEMGDLRNLVEESTKYLAGLMLDMHNAILEERALGLARDKHPDKGMRGLLSKVSKRDLSRLNPEDRLRIEKKIKDIEKMFKDLDSKSLHS